MQRPRNFTKLFIRRIGQRVQTQRVILTIVSTGDRLIPPLEPMRPDHVRIRKTFTQIRLKCGQLLWVRLHTAGSCAKVTARGGMEMILTDEHGHIEAT